LVRTQVSYSAAAVIAGGKKAEGKSSRLSGRHHTENILQRKREMKMVKVVTVVGGLALCVLGGWVVAGENLPAGGKKTKQPATDHTRQYSYAIGLEIGSSFNTDDVQLDIESLLTGLRDGLEDDDPKYDKETCNQAMQQLSEIRMQSHMTRNEEFLEKNSKAEGVHVLPSGLQYKVLKQGDGPSPEATDQSQDPLPRPTDRRNRV